MLSAALGAAVLVLLAVDVFMTVLDASTGAGPYTATQNRLIWRAARGLTPILPGSPRGLSLAAPIMALATPMAWIVLLTVGFALVYHPAIDSFSSNPPVDAPTWAAALYYSGYITSTLGVGDIVPSGSLFRILTVVHASLGFALFSAGITYILSIYSRHTHDTALALHIGSVFRETSLAAWGASGSGGRDDARSLALAVGRDLSAVVVAHEQYPILHYFHGAADRSLIVQVGRLVEWVEQAPEQEDGGASLVVRRLLHDYIAQMPFGAGEREDHTLGERHRRLLEAHGYSPDLP